VNTSTPRQPVFPEPNSAWFLASATPTDPEKADILQPPYVRSSGIIAVGDFYQKLADPFRWHYPGACPACVAESALMERLLPVDLQANSKGRRGKRGS